MNTKTVDEIMEMINKLRSYGYPQERLEIRTAITAATDAKDKELARLTVEVKVRDEALIEACSAFNCDTCSYIYDVKVCGTSRSRRSCSQVHINKARTEIEKENNHAGT